MAKNKGNIHMVTIAIILQPLIITHQLDSGGLMKIWGLPLQVDLMI